METLHAAYQRLLVELATDLRAVCASVERDDEPVLTYGAAQDVHHWLDLPVRDDGAMLGRLRLGFAEGAAAPDAHQLRMAQSLAELAILLSRARWQDDAAPTLQASRRILAVTEDELQRIILDIHDGPVQRLFAASSQIAVMQDRLAQLPEPPSGSLESDLGRIGNLLQTSLDEIKHTLGALRPPEFRRRPLVSVIHGLIMQHESLTGVRVELKVENDLPPVSLPVKIALYRILQEALSNAYRHADVDRLDVRLSSDGDWVTLDVRDAGRGFEPPPLEGPAATEQEEHIGLRGMRDRAQLVGGQIWLTSRPGQGTRIQVKVPTDV